MAFELRALGMAAQTADGKLRVFTASGQLLDPLAAQVLQSLGGETPQWLRVVEGLHAAWDDRADARSLGQLAEVLAAPPQTQVAVARQSDDGTILVGLAAAGVAAVIQNPRCSMRAWDLLRSHDDEFVRDLADDLAWELPVTFASHPDPDTRARVARNHACSSLLLDRLLREPTDDILFAVAGNPSASRRTLKHIARFKVLHIRAAVAANPTFPVRSFRAEALLCDRDGLVLAAFARRTNVSGRFLRRVEGLTRGRARRYPMVLAALKNNPKTPKRLRRRVVKKLSAPTVRRTGRLQMRLRWMILAIFVTGFLSDWRRASAAGSVLGLLLIWYVVGRLRRRRKR